MGPVKPKSPGGSKWRKWDLHVHTPDTKLNSGYVVSADRDIWDEFCEKIEQSDVEVIGITDYFSADNYKTFLERYNKIKDFKDTLNAQGIREHACEILDGGKAAFENREKKYGFK